MRQFETHEALQNYLYPLRKQGKTIGFVPTMGALHQGHLSLLLRAKAENDLTICSVFVNPTQFNNPDDLKNYPRELESDIKKLESINCDILFAPSVKEMYPEPPTEKYDFGQLENVMEGKHRPGHFNGVGVVVKRLFDKVLPHKAYFGLKDFQQLAIIKKLTKDCNLPTEIIPCEIVREKSGLAMSSRNMLLSDKGKQHALLLYNTLKEVKQQSGKIEILSVISTVEDIFKKDKNVKLEYFEIVDSETLQAVNNWNESDHLVACIAAYVENVRLIDNIILFS
jgi:pantoate--beta-alanine ligase